MWFYVRDFLMPLIWEYYVSTSTLNTRVMEKRMSISSQVQETDTGLLLFEATKISEKKIKKIK